MADAAYRNLFFKFKQKAVDDGISTSTATANSVTLAPDTLLECQRKPTKAQSAAYLDLGEGRGFQGIDYQLRMSKESWAPEAEGRNVEKACRRNQGQDRQGQGC